MIFLYNTFINKGQIIVPDEGVNNYNISFWYLYQFKCEQLFLLRILRRMQSEEMTLFVGVHPRELDALLKVMGIKANANDLKETKKERKKKVSKCNFCTSEFDTIMLLSQHVEKKHEGMTISSKPSHGINCEKCDKSFKTKKYKLRHIRAKHSGVTFNCDECTYRATRKTDVASHKSRIHERSSPKYSCEHCGFLAKYKQSMTEHQQSKHGDDLFKCDECSFISKIKKSLQKHKRRHNKCQNPVYCGLCPAKFFSEKLLWGHERKSHNMEQVFKCDQCGYTPKRKGNLMKHKQSIHGNFVLSCDQCVWQTKDESNLRKHIRLKHNSFMQQKG